MGNEFGRLDVLVQNAAISNTSTLPGQSVEEYAKTIRPSNVSLDEMRAVWDTNVFGVLAVYQAMLPILRETPGARIVNVSSGVGSLTANSDPAFTHRAIFGPVYPASKTALNALTVAMEIELEPEGIKVNAVSPGFTKTNLNGYAGTETVEAGAREFEQPLSVEGLNRHIEERSASGNAHRSLATRTALLERAGRSFESVFSPEPA